MSKIVTFDFDETLTKVVPSGTWDGKSLVTDWDMVDNEPIIEIAKRHYEAGDTLAIVTFRYPHQGEAVDGFVKAVKEKHGIEFKGGIYFTGSKPKTEVIYGLKSTAHYDDLILVHMELHKYGLAKGHRLLGGIDLFLVRNWPIKNSTEEMYIERNLVKLITTYETGLEDKTQKLTDKEKE